VVHACNPSYLGGRDWEDCCWMPVGGQPGEKDQETTSQPIVGCGGVSVIPAMQDSINRRIAVRLAQSETLPQK
jgi:hypothetical protein